MSLGATIRTLGRIDARSIRRDPMLRWLVVLPLVLAPAFRYGVPIVTEALRARIGFDLAPYYALVMSFLVPTMPGFAGTVIGFLLLDQRDDDTLTALLVTPMRLGDYVAYRLAVPVVLGVLLTMVILPVAGLVPMTATQVVVTSLVVAPLAPMYALFLASFASNKVQGFALAKGAGILFIPIIAAWFIPSPWQELIGVIPLYWPLKVFWLFDAGAPWVSIWAYAIAGVAYQVAILALLTRRFARVVRR